MKYTGPYNIQIQLVSLIFLAIEIIVFFVKSRRPSKANIAFRVVMGVVFASLVFDILSVITITKYLNGQTEIEALNNFLSKFYIVLMLAYICANEIYIIINTAPKSISQKKLSLKYFESIVCILFFIVASVIVAINPLYYGYGSSVDKIFSYGIPSKVVYFSSICGFIFSLVLFIVNLKKVPFNRLVPIVAYWCVQIGITVIQMFYKEILLVGLGSAIVCMIMYFALEDPNTNAATQLQKVNAQKKNLLLNIFPAKIAEKNEKKIQQVFEEYENVAVLFLDIMNFSQLAKEFETVEIVKTLNSYFSELDDLLNNFKVEKIKTVGDAYMVVAGIPESYENTCDEIIKFARQTLRVLNDFNKRKKANLEVRIGVSYGNVVAGIIGKKKFVFDIWGQAVNEASRLECYGEANRINVSKEVCKLLGTKYQYEEKVSSMTRKYGSIKSFLIM